MNVSATLLILAAGLGTRFKGGIKQLTRVGSAGEILMEFSAYDAVQAGFDRIVFIIRKDIEEQFKELIGDKLSKHIKVEYCFQDMDVLPEGFAAPADRTKPWGTVHAVLAAKEYLNEPFLIINADDYYGKNAYKDIYKFLTASSDASAQCMGGFILKNTLSSTGTVTRGVCTSNEKGCLSSVTETYKICREEDGKVYGEPFEERIEVSEDSVVSMNMWGCTAQIVPMLEKCFADFLEKAQSEGTLSTAEYALPTAFDVLIKNKDITVKVLPTNDRWYGMTHTEDTPEVIEAFAEMTGKGLYPSPLFE